MDPLLFFSRYAMNLTAAHYPALTRRRRAHRTAETEILLLGDSHGWGQGAAGYDAILPGYPVHRAAPSSNGFFERLRLHILKRNGFYEAAHVNRELHRPMDDYRPLTGVSRRICKTFGEHREAAGFYAPDAVSRADLDTYGYLATDGKWTEDLLVIAPGEGREANGYVDMCGHASKLFIGVLAGAFGAKLHVYFHNRDGRKGNSAGALYPLAEDYPKITRVSKGRHLPVHAHEAASLQGGGVVIDTFDPEEEQERVYCIDYGQKQRGRLCLAYAGAHELAVPPQWSALHATVPHPAVCLRGWRFDGNDVRNFSMGGHTVGQWLGDGTPSFSDASMPHIDQLLRYVPFTPTLVIVQVPIVNEYLRQTAPEALAGNLQALMSKLNGHLNEDGSVRTDFLLLTTPGDKRILHEGATSASIGYEDYYETVRAFALETNVGLIDFARYFKDCVEAGLLDYELLFDDPIHPGPYAHDFIGRLLGQALDMVM